MNIDERLDLDSDFKSIVNNFVTDDNNALLILRANSIDCDCFVGSRGNIDILAAMLGTMAADSEDFKKVLKAAIDHSEYLENQ